MTSKDSVTCLCCCKTLTDPCYFLWTVSWIKTHLRTISPMYSKGNECVLPNFIEKLGKQKYIAHAWYNQTQISKCVLIFFSKYRWLLSMALDKSFSANHSSMSGKSFGCVHHKHQLTPLLECLLLPFGKLSVTLLINLWWVKLWDHGKTS